MALGVLRLIFVASIFAFVLTVRTVAPIHAAEGDPADPTPSTVLGEEPLIDPPPPDPPTEPPTGPPVEAGPPPADPVEPPPTDPPPADTTEAEPPPEPPTEAEPPPADPVEPAPTDPPADPVETVMPPPDPPVEAELPPEDTTEPAPTDPPVSDPIVPPLGAPSTIIGDPDASDPSATQAAPSFPSTHPPAPVADNRAQATTELVVAIARTQTRMKSDESAHPIALAPAIAGAGLAAGLAITNHAPSTVAVAIEFGRAGGGWAGALVFNLWLRRQMRERRMSQRRLADLAGVDHSTISRLLRQDRRPSLTTATKLARALKQVPGEQGEPETADYFERIPEETVFPARRVELALRADEMLNDEQVRRLMNIYLGARRRNEASRPTDSAAIRAAPARAAPDARR